MILALALALAGCSDINLRFWESSREEASPGEASPAESAGPSQGEEARQETVTAPISLTAQGQQVSYLQLAGLGEDGEWLLQAMQWLDRDRLVLVVADGRQSSAGSVIMAKTLLLDLAAGEQTAVITLPDATVTQIEQRGSRLFLYDASTVYTVSLEDYSLVETAPAPDLTAVSGDLLLYRDRDGVMLRDLTGAAADTRVARNETAYDYGESLLWSPDGQMFLIKRQSAGSREDNGMMICARSGEMLHEIDIPSTYAMDDDGLGSGRYAFSIRWAADSRSFLVVDSTTLRSYSAAAGEQTARSANVFSGPGGSVQDAWGSRAVGLYRSGDQVVAAALELPSGEVTELLELTGQATARYSPGGDRIALMQNENTGRLYFLTP